MAVINRPDTKTNIPTLIPVTFDAGITNIATLHQTNLLVLLILKMIQGMNLFANEYLEVSALKPCITCLVIL